MTTTGIEEEVEETVTFQLSCRCNPEDDNANCPDLVIPKTSEHNVEIFKPTSYHSPIGFKLHYTQSRPAQVQKERLYEIHVNLEEATNHDACERDWYDRYEYKVTREVCKERPGVAGGKILSHIELDQPRGSFHFGYLVAVALDANLKGSGCNDEEYAQLFFEEIHGHLMENGYLLLEHDFKVLDRYKKDMEVTVVEQLGDVWC
ncbi:hypothetical protein BJ508DRAFT_324997 [Ascobolus immersus RN42]|uniref:Uncharacterized protein n=1 Tax=Ascobolus immersus RN42 TaxID=1160509 RepID=A0A3N4I9T6_ASCIM|nr:hypothetical protein BJ508DRAFT_324997 [Ascobolus immersus RN42]